MNQDGNLARRIVTRLSANGGELPALLIGGHHYSISALRTMNESDRGAWGPIVAKCIEQFINAIDREQRVLVIDIRRSTQGGAPETTVEALPVNEWVVVKIKEQSQSNANDIPIMITGMDMDAL